MRAGVLALKSMRHRLGSVMLTVGSMAIGVALLLGVERIRHEAKVGFTNTISGTDLIVGARTGSVSLLLNSIFHIGYATDNVSWGTYQRVEQNPQVAWTIPLSLGDSHEGYAVLGTTNAYFQHYRYGAKQSLRFAEGGAFSGTYDAVLGAEVAKKLGYRVGQEVVIAHGSGAVSFVKHSENPFTVVGVLQTTGTPVDQTVHVRLEGIEAIHQNFDGGHVHHEGCTHPSHRQPASLDAFEAALTEQEETDFTPTEITAFLVGMHSRADAVMLQSAVNQHQAEALTAVLPGVALAELWQVVAVVERVLLVISLLVLGVSLSALFTTLVLGFNERRREMAILRSVGARPRHLLGMVVGEAALVSGMAIVIGLLLVSSSMFVLQPILQEALGILVQPSWPSFGEWLILLAVFCAGVLTAVYPAWRCYQNSLSDGLTVKL